MKYATICKTFDFDAAHRLDRLPPDHKCHRLHGHTYRVDVVVHGAINPHTGFIVDYAEIAKAWAPLHSALDHRHLNDVPGLEVPSTENLAHWIIDHLKIPGLERVRVWESSSSYCEALAIR